MRFIYKVIRHTWILIDHKNIKNQCVVKISQRRNIFFDKMKGKYFGIDNCVNKKIKMKTTNKTIFFPEKEEEEKRPWPCISSTQLIFVTTTILIEWVFELWSLNGQKGMELTRLHSCSHLVFPIFLFTRQYTIFFYKWKNK